MRKSLDIIYPLLLCVLFLIIAFYRLGNGLPPGMNHDAAWNGLYAIRILNGEPFTSYTPEAWGRETLFHYTLALFFRAFGIKKETIEITAIFFGLLSIPIFYFVLFSLSKSKLLSFLLSLFWVSSSALIIYSRAGWRLITLIPAALLLMLALSFYQAKKGGKNALLIGLSSALVLYTYNGGRAVILFFFLFWLISLYVDRFKKRSLLDFAYSLFALAVVSLPMINFAIREWSIFWGRATHFTENAGFDKLIQNFKSAALFYNVKGGGGDFITDFPVLEGPVSLFWVVGLFFALRQFKRYWAYLLLFFFFWLPAAITLPSFHRAAGTLPLVYFFSLIPFFYLNERITKSWGKKIFLTLTLSIAFVQTIFSLNKLYLERKPFISGFYPEATIVGGYLKEHNFNENKTVIYAGNWPKEVLTFMSLKNPNLYVRDQEIKNNYAPYNSLSKDGLPELIADLKMGRLHLDSTFVVGAVKKDLFVSSLEKNGFMVEEKDSIKNKQGETTAFVYEIKECLIDE